MQPAVERSTGERYEHVLRFSKNISGSRSSQEVMGAVASELPSVLTYDYVSLFLNDERRYGTGCYELTQEGQSILASWVFEHRQAALIPGGEIHIRHAAKFLSQRGMQSVCVIPVTANWRFRWPRYSFHARFEPCPGLQTRSR
jgi:K+-sensing histidine kinase KdpD